MQSKKANLAGFLADLSNIGALPFVIVSTIIAVAEFGPPSPTWRNLRPSHEALRIIEPSEGAIVVGNEVGVTGAGVASGRSVFLFVQGPGGGTIQNFDVQVTPTGVFDGRAAIGNTVSPAAEYRIRAFMSAAARSSVLATNKIPVDAVWSEPVVVVRK